MRLRKVGEIWASGDGTCRKSDQKCEGRKLFDYFLRIGELYQVVKICAWGRPVF